MVAPSSSDDRTTSNSQEQDQNMRLAQANTVLSLLKMVVNASKTYQRVNNVCLNDKSKIWLVGPGLEITILGLYEVPV